MAKQPINEAITDLPEPDYDFLAPERVSLFCDESGRMRMTVEGDRSYLDVKAVRAFPMSLPDRYVGLLDAAGKDRVIALIVDPERLDADSRATLAEALGRHYFVPEILRIESMKEEFGAVYFDVETDRGPRHFVVKGIRDGMEHTADGELLIKDVDGNRFRIVDWQALDGRSRRFLVDVV